MYSEWAEHIALEKYDEEKGMSKYVNTDLFGINEEL